jgi:hypothetical protein
LIRNAKNREEETGFRLAAAALRTLPEIVNRQHMPGNSPPARPRVNQPVRLRRLQLAEHQDGLDAAGARELAAALVAALALVAAPS